MDNNGLNYKINVDAKDALKNINKFQTAMKNAFGDKNTGAGIKTMSKEMSSSIKSMSKDVTEMSKKMSKSVEKSTAGMSSSLKKEFKKMNKLTGTARNTGKLLGKALLKGMQSALTGLASLGKVLFKALSGMAGMFLTLGKTFGTALTSGIRLCSNIMRTTGKFLVSTLSFGIKSGLGLIKGAGKLLVNTLSFSLNGAFKVAANVAGKITGVISKAINQKGRIDLGVDMGNYKTKAYDTMSGDRIARSFNTLFSAMKATMPKQIGSVFESITTGIAGSLGKLGNTVLLASQAFVAIKTHGPKVLSTLGKIGNTIKPYIRATFNLISAFIKLHLGTTFAPLKAGFDYLAAQAKAAGKALVETAVNFVDSLGSSMAGLVGIWKGLESSVNIVKNAFKSAKEKITSFTDSIVNIGKTIKDAIVNGLRTAFGNFKNEMPETFEMLKKSGKSLVTILESIINNLGKIFNSDTLKKAKDAADPWISGLRKIVESISAVLNPLIEPLTKLGTTLLGFSGDFVQSAIDNILKFAKQLGLGVDSIGDFCTKISGKVKDFTTKVGELIDKFTDWLKELPESVQKVIGAAATAAGLYGTKKVLDKTGIPEKLFGKLEGLFTGGDNSFEGAVRRFSRAVDKFAGGSITGKIRKGKDLYDAGKGVIKVGDMLLNKKAVDQLYNASKNLVSKEDIANLPKHTANIQDFVEACETAKKAGKTVNDAVAAMGTAKTVANTAKAAKGVSNAAKGASAAAKGASAAGGLAKAGKVAGTIGKGALTAGKVGLAFAQAHPVVATISVLGTIAAGQAVKEKIDEKNPKKRRERERIDQEIQPLIEEIERVKAASNVARSKARAAMSAPGSSVPFSKNYNNRKTAEKESEALNKYLNVLNYQRKLEYNNRSNMKKLSGYSNNYLEESITSGKGTLAAMKVDFGKLGITLGEEYQEILDKTTDSIRNKKKPFKEFAETVENKIDNSLKKAAESAKAFEQKVNEKSAAREKAAKEKREAKSNAPAKDSLKNISEAGKKAAENLEKAFKGTIANAKKMQTKKAKPESTVNEEEPKPQKRIPRRPIESYREDSKPKSNEKQWDDIIRGYKNRANKIKSNLNSISTDVPREEVEKLNAEFEKAQREFNEIFKIKGTGNGLKGIGNMMEKIGKYSNMLAAIKNPLLTVRTKNAENALKSVTESTKKTKAAYDSFNKAAANVKAVKLDQNATSADKFRASIEKAKASFTLLKNALGTAIKMKGFENATASLARTEKDIEKFKAKFKAIFNTMFDGAKSAAKSGWSKLASIFQKGTTECIKPVDKLKGVISKLAGAFGVYQLGGIFREATQSAIKYDAAVGTIERTLGGASKQLIDFANGNAAAFGLSKEQVASFGNIYSLIVSNFESDANKVAGTTQKLLEAAGTIASATGYAVEDVLENLRSGINGSSEAVDQLGLNLKTANLAAAAGVESWDKLSTEQQQAIIVQEILNQTAAKYGTIADSAASRQAAFTAQLANTKLALGNLG